MMYIHVYVYYTCSSLTQAVNNVELGHGWVSKGLCYRAEHTGLYPLINHNNVLAIATMITMETIIA